MLNKFSNKKTDPFDSMQIDKFLTQKLLLEKILTEKDKIISDLNKELNDVKLNMKEFQQGIEKTKNDKKAEPQEDKKGLLKIIEESIRYIIIENKLINSLKNDNGRTDKLLEEVLILM